MAEPMRVMFLAANPFLDLKINDEVRDIRARIRESVFRNADLDYEPATRASDLIGRLDESKPHVVHFSGHGTEAHDLILLDDQGAPTPVDRDLLAELFRLCRDNLRVVFLNFCHSLPIAEEIRDVVPCVIGTIDAIPDQAARFFAAQFYGSLSSGRTVREAFDRATLQLKLQKIPGGETLRLLHADDVDPNALRLVEPVSAPDADPASDEPRSRSDEPGHSARRGLGAPGRLSRPAGESGAVWRWVETNWDQLTVVLVALALAALTVAVAGRTALGFAIVGVVAVAAGAWLAY
ncbi:MAG TPA: CHAT domain-containing protein, partial [Isosphaeraceae bacterium]